MRERREKNAESVRKRGSLSLAVAESEETGTENSEEAVEDAVGDVNADVASSLAELDAERLEELVADRVLAVCSAARKGQSPEPR
jgi:hypothetical protein